MGVSPRLDATSSSSSGSGSGSGARAAKDTRFGLSELDAVQVCVNPIQGWRKWEAIDIYSIPDFGTGVYLCS